MVQSGEERWWQSLPAQVKRHSFNETWETVEYRSGISQLTDIGYIATGSKAIAAALAARQLEEFVLRPGPMTLKSIPLKDLQDFFTSAEGIVFRQGIGDERSAYVICDAVGTSELTYDFSGNSAAAVELDATLLESFGLSGSSKTLAWNTEKRSLHVNRFQFVGYKLVSIADLVRNGSAAKPLDPEEAAGVLEAMGELRTLRRQMASRSIVERLVGAVASPPAEVAVRVDWLGSDLESAALAEQLVRALIKAGWKVEIREWLAVGAIPGVTIFVAPLQSGEAPGYAARVCDALRASLGDDVRIRLRPEEGNLLRIFVGPKPPPPPG